MKRGLFILCWLALLSACDAGRNTQESSGFAGLGASGEGHTQAHAGMTLNFPDDHGPHPGFRIEWWYLTANLQDAQGQSLGVQWTLFRQAQQPATAESTLAGPWAVEQIWMAHMALSRGEQHRVAERFARGTDRVSGDQQAGVTAQPFSAWLDDWQLNSLSATEDQLDRLRLRAEAKDGHGNFGYELELEASGPLVRHGIKGFSQKSADGQGSMYYSQPFYRVSGKVWLNGEPITVSGQAWLDREWSSQLLSKEQSGWDWFSLHLESGYKLMAFRLRGGSDNNSDYVSGSWISPVGEVTPLSANEIILKPLANVEVAGRRVPVRWQLTLPAQQLELTVTAHHANRWMNTSVPYWEGAVSVTDADSGRPLGQGYLEMTGY
ncbi:lipocalin-like domain-containing protein [Oceanimonas sp. CHS3-5]|uniref:lipocalin-like domain-containing protein n=1 Tax=Oceanimonas sp. CHS3-5 TaxID=3068186 RepID=UPI00273ECD2A|nr:lipocalin-like domain-containing protein [Oceanimonas sp. CHS3-5]MDP5291247.1 lipocalin-like domain-containing protein [Oceanimonas sp. CHS3-5]